MEKLKRLQAGEDVEELLAEIDEEMPSNDEGNCRIHFIVHDKQRNNYFFGVNIYLNLYFQYILTKNELRFTLLV